MTRPTLAGWCVVLHALLGTTALQAPARADVPADVVDGTDAVGGTENDASAPQLDAGSEPSADASPTDPMPADHGHAHGALDPHGGLAPTGAGMRVLVLRRDAAGTLAPMAGVPLRRERYRRKTGMDEGADLVAAWTLTTGPSGEVVVPAEPVPGPGESDRIVAIWNGVDWELDPQEPAASAPRTITIHDVTTDTTAFALEADLEVTFVDDHFIIRENISLVNQGLAAIDFTRGAGLRVPLLVHELFGEPNDIGFLPLRPDTRHTSFSVSPATGRVAVERGALVFRGVVPPGPSVSVRAVLTVPYVGVSDHRLAMRSPHPMRVVFNVLVPPRSGIRVALAGPHRGAEMQRADGVLRVMAPLEPLAANEPVTLVVEHTPDRRPVMRTLGMALGGGALFVISAIFFATRRGSARRQG
jgi:hypothetical protein